MGRHVSINSIAMGEEEHRYDLSILLEQCENIDEKIELLQTIIKEKEKEKNEENEADIDKKKEIGEQNMKKSEEELQEFSKHLDSQLYGLQQEGLSDMSEFGKKSLEHQYNSPTFLRYMHKKAQAIPVDTAENVESVMEILDKLQSLCEFLAAVSQNDDNLRQEYLEISAKASNDFDKASNERNRLEFEEYKDMGGDLTYEEYIAEVDDGDVGADVDRKII